MGPPAARAVCRGVTGAGHGWHATGPGRRRACCLRDAANLMEWVMPQTGLRQWVLTFPFSWRRCLSQDGLLLGRLSRIFAETVQPSRLLPQRRKVLAARRRAW